MRVAFAGTPEFARVALAALHAAGFDVAAGADAARPAGGPGPEAAGLAGQGARARARHCRSIQPRGPAARRPFMPTMPRRRAPRSQAAAPDAVVVAAYGLILPRWLLELPPLRLPQHPRLAAAALARRGADPPRDRGRRRHDRRHDHADGRRPGHRRDAARRADADPAPTTTRPALQARLAALRRRARRGGAARGWPAAASLARPQPDDGVDLRRTRSTSARRRSTGAQPAATIERRLRAFDPFPGRRHDARRRSRSSCWRGRVGTGARPSGRDPRRGRRAASRSPAATGALALTSLQRPGGRRLAAAEFLQRGRVEPGMQFGAPAV